MSRGDVVSKMWDYIKKNKLQNPENKREIIADDKLQPIFGKKKVTMFEMNKHLAQHLKYGPLLGGSPPAPHACAAGQGHPKVRASSGPSNGMPDVPHRLPERLVRAHDEARIPIMDRGFLFADGVYEVCAVLNGQLVDNDAHLARLGRSLQEIRIANPYPAAEWTRLEGELVRRNELVEGSSTCR